MPSGYQHISARCESYFDRFGDNFRGVGWTKSQQEVDTRYRAMLDVVRQDESSLVSLLDFGCGLSHLYEYIRKHQLDFIEYSGLDISERFIQLSRKKFPQIQYHHLDVLVDDSALGEYDYIILGGVFNSKCDFTFDEMFDYFRTVLGVMFPHARRGLAFNVMSKQVDWERDDLFHLPMDSLASFLASEISRDFVIRHDYGLYEYTTYVYP